MGGNADSLYRVKELVATQPGQEGTQERLVAQILILSVGAKGSLGSEEDGDYDGEDWVEGMAGSMGWGSRWG